ncbi:MAG: segregation/condensation protein A [Candidatus Omnitrophica bacterium]|nr:segregation/condensation protein A [Candidatus Omnitrophota bacterium]
MRVKLDIFEGPLDLLLYLIKKNHIDISQVCVSNVVEQYLEFINLMQVLDINIASEYMVMAATLINIKSKLLLPQETTEEPEEVSSQEELIKKLLEYQKFKEAAAYLKQRERERLRYISRSTPDKEREVYIEASIFDLINAFKSALKEVPKDIFFEVVRDEFTVEEKMHDLLHLLLEREKISLEEFFSSAQNKLEIIVIFLAILELIRLREIVAIQKDLFSEILIVRRDKIYSSI